MFQKIHISKWIVALLAAVVLAGCGLGDVAKNLQDQAKNFVAKLQVSEEQVKTLVKLGSRASQIVAARLQEAQGSLTTAVQNTGASLAAAANDSAATNLDTNLNCSTISPGTPTLNTFENCPNTEGQISYTLTKRPDTTSFDVTFTKYREHIGDPANFLALDGSSNWDVSFNNSTVKIETGVQLQQQFYAAGASSETPVEVTATGTVNYTFDVLSEKLTLDGTRTYIQGKSSKTLSYHKVIFDFGADGCPKGPSDGTVIFTDPIANKIFSIAINKCGKATVTKADGTVDTWIATDLEDFFADTLKTLESTLNALDSMYKDNVAGDYCANAQNATKPECTNYYQNDWCVANPTDSVCSSYGGGTTAPIPDCNAYPNDPSCVAPGSPRPELVGTWCWNDAAATGECYQFNSDGTLMHLDYDPLTCQQPKQWGTWNTDTVAGPNWVWLSVPAPGRTVEVDFTAGAGVAQDTIAIWQGAASTAFYRSALPTIPLCSVGTNCQDDTYEPNNINTSATYLTQLDTYSSLPVIFTSLVLQDNDWYQVDTGFSSGVNTYLYADILNYSGKSSPTLEWYGATGGTSTAVGSGSVSTAASDNQTHLLRIYRDPAETDACPSYELSLDWY